MRNKELKNFTERELILSLIGGAVQLTGAVELDNDDDDGFFTITQEYTNLRGDTVTRKIIAQLQVTKVTEV